MMLNRLTFFLFAVLTIVQSPSMLFAQQNGYKQTNLTANTSGVANQTDPQLVNPWGIAFLPGNPFWIANNRSGTSTLYDAQGNLQQLVVTIPSASVNPCSPGCPTGIIANNSADFNGGAFIFDTDDGIIANWTGANSAVVAVDNSAGGADYKGLALLNNGSANFLLAANFSSGKIDVFDRNFKPAALAGTFSDPNLPAGFAPHAVHIINSQVYVAYAMQDATKRRPVHGAGIGVVDVFDANGNFVKTFATGGQLNAPWAVVATPASFGTFSNAILVGNFGDGTISAFDSTGKSLGQVTDSANNVITNPGLWDMVFGAGGTGDPNTLYFTAGGPTLSSGLFATLAPAGNVSTGDFTLVVSPLTASVAQGQSTNISVSATPSGGFSGTIALNCSAPTGVTCAFSPTTIAPGSSAASSTLMLTTSAVAPPGGYVIAGVMGWLPFSGLAPLGMVFGFRKRKYQAMTKSWKVVLWSGIVCVLALGLLFTAGCGSSSNSSAGSTVTVMVTGTSGAITHSTPVALTIH